MVGVSFTEVESCKRTRFKVGFGHLESSVVSKIPLRYLRRHLKQYVDPVELKFQRDEWRDLHIVHLCVGSEGVIECICGGQMHVSNIGMERKEDLGRRLKKIPVVNGLARDVRHTS